MEISNIHTETIDEFFENVQYKQSPSNRAPGEEHQLRGLDGHQRDRIADCHCSNGSEQQEVGHS